MLEDKSSNGETRKNDAFSFWLKMWEGSIRSCYQKDTETETEIEIEREKDFETGDFMQTTS